MFTWWRQVLVGGGGLTSRVAASVSVRRRLILEGDGNVVGGGGLASNMLRRPSPGAPVLASRP